MPGVDVGEMPIGGMVEAQVLEELDRVWNQEYTLTVIDSSDMQRRWVASPAEFGLSVDAAATAHTAVSIGRGGTLFQNLAEIWMALFGGIDVQPTVALDPSQALAGLQSWAAEVDILPMDAQILFRNGEVEWTEAQAGNVVDVLATLEFLRQNAASSYIDQRAIPLVMESVEPGIEDVSAAIYELEDMLEASPSLQLYDPVRDEWIIWAPSPSEFIDWINLEPNGGSYQVELMPSVIEGYIQDHAAEMGEERTLNSRLALEALMIELEGGSAAPVLIEYLPRSHVVRAGDNLVALGFEYGIPYWKIYEFNPDLVIRGLHVGEEIVIPPRDSMLEVQVVPNKRIVISISQQYMSVYQNQQLMSEHVISTGIDDSPTMPGIFQILTHEENAYASIWDLYMPHFMGIYYATPDLLNGIHGLPLLSSGRRLWADILGRPASYGCIILDLQTAEQLFYWAETGVVVEIQS
jgi:hypothetical protein